MARWYCAASWKVRWPDTRPNPTPEARHTDPRITTEVYGHLVPGYLRDAINKLPLAGTADLLPANRESEEKEAPFGPPVVRTLPAPKTKAGSASKNLSEIRPSSWLRGQDL